MAIGDPNTFIGNDDTNEVQRNNLEIQRDIGDLLNFDDAYDGYHDFHDNLLLLFFFSYRIARV